MPLKGVILAGGSGTRLFPLTLVTNKHLLPVYDRPMIFYPLATLADMGVRETMVVVGGRSVGDVLELLHDGTDFDLDLSYRYQRGALGIAHALGLARPFAGDDPIAVILGDNIVHGSLRSIAEAFVADGADGAAILKRVPDPERFGVAEFDQNGRVVGFEEKPKRPKSDLIPIGIYFFRPAVFDILSELEPSGRGEFEITDVLNTFIERGSFATYEFDGEWQDAGTIESLLLASTFASGFAAEMPSRASVGPEAVEAEHVDPRTVRP
jgi:glucose-1-phosphate thymidylyltransferase